MNCKEVRKYFTAFLRGDITSPKKEVIAAHVGHCESCKDKFRQFINLSNIFSKLKAPESEELFWENYLEEIKEKLDKPQKKEKKKIIKSIELTLFLKKPAYAVAALLILVIGIIAYQKWIPDKENIVYSNSLEFFLEEFDAVVAENIFVESFPFEREDIKLFSDFQYNLIKDVENE